MPTGARKLRINQSDLDTYGYTDRCPQCEHAKKHGKVRPGGYHSDACRMRIIDCIRDTEDGSRRLNKQEFREARPVVDRDDYVNKRHAQDARVEAVRARERAADAALPSDRIVLVRGTGSGQTEAERRASVEAQNERDLQSSSESLVQLQQGF